MPSMRIRVAATTANALANQKFALIPSPGAILNVWAAGVTATDDIALSVDNVAILDPSDINIESSADVIDNDRDQIIFNEVVGPGQLFMPCTVTTELQVLISLKYLGQ